MGKKDRPFAEAFAAKLKELRGLADLTLAELAAKCDPPMHGPAVARYESGVRLPSWAAVVRLATALGVTTDVFRPFVKPPRRPR